MLTFPVGECPVVHVQWRQRNVRKKCAVRTELLFRALFVFVFVFFFCKLRLRYRRLIAVPDEFLTGWKIWAVTSLTQNCSIFCSVHTDLEQLRVYKFLRLRWFRVGTEHLNAQVFSRSKTRPVPCERSPNKFACWIFFRIINATGQLYSGQNYST